MRWCKLGRPKPALGPSPCGRRHQPVLQAPLVVIIRLPVMLGLGLAAIELLIGHGRGHDLESAMLLAKINRNLLPIDLGVQPEAAILVDRQCERIIQGVFAAL